MSNWYWIVINSSLNLPGTINNKLRLINSIDEARKNMLAVKIFYEDLSYTYIEETPVWTELTLISSFGGQLGLFVGISLLSFVEIFELIIKVIILKYKEFQAKSVKIFDFKTINNKPII